MPFFLLKTSSIDTKCTNVSGAFYFLHHDNSFNVTDVGSLDLPAAWEQNFRKADSLVHDTTIVRQPACNLVALCLRRRQTWKPFHKPELSFGTALVQTSHVCHLPYTRQALGIEPMSFTSSPVPPHLNTHRVHLPCCHIG